MRASFLLSLFLVIAMVGGYFFVLGSGICPSPLAWRIGVLDERFGLEYSEAIAAVEAGAAIWEEATGRDLFVHDDTADFPVNFIFDERQAFSNAEANFKDRLDNAEAANDSFESTYESLVSEYEDLEAAYQAATAAYEVSLDAYNAKVAAVNAEGGAKPVEYAALEREQRQLNREAAKLNAMVDDLNDYITRINEVGEQGNRLIETYNRGVEVYNDTFGEAREFTQGDYQGDKINIYTFSDEAELQLVLAHELGHALHLDHVENSQSVLYFLIGDQPTDLVLSAEDIAEFDRVCEPRNFWQTIMTGYHLVFADHTHSY